jgi:diguanylate cyclase (GGDEF)-like protein
MVAVGVRVSVGNAVGVLVGLIMPRKTAEGEGVAVGLKAPPLQPETPILMTNINPISLADKPRKMNRFNRLSITCIRSNFSTGGPTRSSSSAGSSFQFFSSVQVEFISNYKLYAILNTMRALTGRNFTLRLLLAALGILLYLLAFVPLSKVVGSFVILLGMLPVVVAGGLLGTLGGLISGLVVYILAFLLLENSNSSIAASFFSVPVLSGLTAMLVTGLISGWISDLNRRLRKDLLAQSLDKETLKASEQNLRSLVSNAPALLFALDRAGNFTLVEGGNLSPDEISLLPRTGQNIRDYAKSNPAFAGEIERILAGENTLLHIPLPSGRTYQTQQTVQRNSQGEVIGIIGVAIDVTDHLQIEKVLREQTNLSEALRDGAAALNSTLRTDEVLDRILTDVNSVVPHDAANLMLVEDGMLRIVRHTGYNQYNLFDHAVIFHLPVEEIPILQKVAESDQPLLVPDTQADPLWVSLPEADWVRSYAGAAIRIKGQAVGFLNLEASTTNFFTPAQTEALQAFADQAALAIQNAQLYEATQQQLEQQSALLAASTAISSSLDLERVLCGLAEQLVRALDLTSARIYTWDSSSGLASVVAETFGQQATREERTPTQGSAFNLVEDFGNNLEEWLLAGKSLESQLDDPVLFPRLRRRLLAFGGKSALSIPLVVKGASIGFADLWESRRRRVFSQPEIAMAQGIAQQAAIAIENARLFQETTQRARSQAILNEITRAALASNDLPSMLQTLADRLGDLFGADGSFITLWDETNERTIPFAASGAQNENYRKLLVPPGERTLTSSVLSIGRPLAVEDVYNTPYMSPQIATLFNARSLLGLPLIADGRKLGAALVQFQKTHSFSPVEIALGEQAAGQIALAIAKTRSIEAERQQTTQLYRSNRLITALSGVAMRIQAIQHPSEVVGVLRAELHRLALSTMVALRCEDSPDFEIVYGSLNSESIELLWNNHDAHNAIITPRDFPLYRQVVENKTPTFLETPTGVLSVALPGYQPDQGRPTKQLARISPQTKALFLPLLVSDHVSGMLWIWGEDLQENDLPIFNIFAGQVTVTLENARLYSELQTLAITDSGTLVFNRRGLFAMGRREVERSRRYNRPLSIILFDIDQFKQVNDTYGHAAGDRVLAILAARARLNIREIDLLARYGGEEFVILLPETDLTFACQVAERLRRAASQEPVPTSSGEIVVTISLGVAQLESNTTDLESLIAAADEAMYRAKAAGRNQVASINRI